MVWDWNAISAVSTFLAAVVALFLGLMSQRQSRSQLLHDESEQALECARMELYLARRFMDTDNEDKRMELINLLNSYEMKLTTLGYELHIEVDTLVNKDLDTLHEQVSKCKEEIKKNFKKQR
ncbi:MAG: hypothetical protein M3Z48_03045 [Lactobacillus sp.]|uniref:hypothetical protein n=1 Tax=Bifidobacterium sp. 7101 TaxID=1394175 RepID=UPI0004A2B2A3|nr:hypothetical protein [Bifidobacterium sp. 7101]MCT6902187.1 hypothetical protein [Lactobacillus sp.]